MTWQSAIGICLIGAASVTSSIAQEKVTASGCPTMGVELNCLILKQGNVTYDISAANPRPRVGSMAIRLSGTRSNRVGFCQQGVILEAIEWSYTDEKCE